MTSSIPEDAGLTIDKRSIPDRVADLLMRKILSGTFMPGSRIVESRVAAEIGVAQSSVREALRKLQYLGVVEHKRHIGAIVKVSDPDDARIAVPIRAKIEEVAIVEAIRRKIDTAPLREFVETMLAAKSFDAGTDAHTDFHHYISDMSGSPMLTELWDLTIWRTSSLFFHGTSDDDVEDAVRSHLAIIEFIEAGDPTGAEQLALDHIRRGLT